ncbi:LXG domain-containing protein [Sporosarcina sp. FSL K6-6792]|uniref:ribonuclease YeeF family protein n=1 Tax=Sporosarcina sp. FSL K6-6792 TaxID=2921559 RepID=UPI0030F66138
MEDSLKGEGGDAIRAFYAECHLPFLQFFMTFKSNYANVLTQMDSALDSLEPDMNGFIRETFLEGEVEAGLTEISQLTSSLTDEANDIMNQVADIVALPHLNDSDVQEGVRDARRKRDHTIADLYEFDANQTRALMTIENDLKTMETWLSDIEGLFTDGVTAIDFPMDKWAALSAKNTLQTDLAQRTAGMDGINGGQGSGDELGNLVGANTSEDEQLKALYAAMEKEQRVGNPVNDYAIDPNTGEYIMMNQGLVRVSKDYGPKELSLIDKAGLGVANFLILDDLKTITDPDSSYMAKGLSMASITPFGPAIKAGTAGIRLVRKSSIVKWISPKKVEKATDKGIGNSKWKSAELLDELANNGVKYNPDELMAITKTASGKLAWIEKGNSNAGFEHVMLHADEFAAKGIKSNEIPDLLMEALSKGKVVGTQGRGNGRPIYEVVFNGQKQRVAITVGNNGFIVGANPKSLP